MTKNVGGIDRIVAEVLLLELMFLKAVELEIRNAFRIKDDLHLDIFGRRTKRPGDLTGKALVGIFWPIKEVITPVALLRQRRENFVIQAIGTDTTGVKSDPGIAHPRNLSGEIFGKGIAQIGGPIGEENDAILGALEKLLLRQLETGGKGCLQIGASFGEGIADNLS